MVYNRGMSLKWIIDASLFPLSSSISLEDEMIIRKIRDRAVFCFFGHGNPETASRLANEYHKLNLKDEQILTLPQAAALVLRNQDPQKRRAQFFGSKVMKEAFRKAGFEESMAPDYVIFADPVHASIDELSDLLYLVEHGTQIVSLSGCLKYRRDEMNVLAAGAVVRMLEEVTGISAIHLDSFANAFVPALTMMRREKSNRDKIIVSGQPENVLAPAEQAGMKTILVSSAMAPDTDLFGLPVHPDWIIQNFHDLSAAL